MTCPIVLIRRKPHLHRRTFRLQRRLAAAAEFQCQEDRGSRHDLGQNPNQSHSRKRRVDDIGNGAPGNRNATDPHGLIHTLETNGKNGQQGPLVLRLVSDGERCSARPYWRGFITNEFVPEHLCCRYRSISKAESETRRSAALRSSEPDHPASTYASPHMVACR